MRLVKLFISAVLLMGINGSINAATYYTTGTGDWDDDIWSTDTNGTGVAFSSLTLIAGDTIYIDDNITVNNNTSIGVDVTILLDAELRISKQLSLTSGSLLSVTSNGTVIATGGGSSPKIKFGTGTAQWNGTNGTLVGPGTMDVTTNDGTLPVDLIFFTALTLDKQVHLSWATASEENFDYFEIQRAVGSDEFASIGALSGAGENVFSLQEYEFYDEYSLDGINYYRLKIIDLDGTFEYSDIQAVKMEVSGAVAVFPNPIQNQQLQLVSTYTNPQQYHFYDTRGTLILSGEFSNGPQSVRLPELQSGLYILKVSGIGVSQIIKVLVD